MLAAAAAASQSSFFVFCVSCPVPLPCFCKQRICTSKNCACYFLVNCVLSSNFKALFASPFWMKLDRKFCNFLPHHLNQRCLFSLWTQSEHCCLLLASSLYSLFCLNKPCCPLVSGSLCCLFCPFRPGCFCGKFILAALAALPHLVMAETMIKDNR